MRVGSGPTEVIWPGGKKHTEEKRGCCGYVWDEKKEVDPVVTSTERRWEENGNNDRSPETVRCGRRYPPSSFSHVVSYLEAQSSSLNLAERTFTEKAGGNA